MKCALYYVSYDENVIHKKKRKNVVKSEDIFSTRMFPANHTGFFASNVKRANVHEHSIIRRLYDFIVNLRSI